MGFRNIITLMAKHLRDKLHDIPLLTNFISKPREISLDWLNSNCQKDFQFTDEPWKDFTEYLSLTKTNGQIYNICYIISNLKGIYIF